MKCKVCNLNLIKLRPCSKIEKKITKLYNNKPQLFIIGCPNRNDEQHRLFYQNKRMKVD
jgi:hypothetical protein